MTIINYEMTLEDIVLTFDDASIVTKIYLDSVENKDNMYSNDDEKHEVTIDSITPLGNIITIDNSKYNYTGCIVTAVSNSTTATKLVYNEDILFKNKIALLTSFCSTCLDKEQKIKIVLCDFKSQLFEYAVSNNKLNDSIELFRDLSRILGCNCGKCDITGSKATRCERCANGCCAL